MDNNTASIIVPVYNQSDKVERCVNSLLLQTYQNIEIIIVDDGSTDGSYEKCCKIASSDSRLIVKRQANSGVSQARNTGITYASGKYMMFADSDDWLDPKCVEVYINEYDKESLNIFSYYLMRQSTISKITLKSNNLNKDAVITKLDINSVPELYRKQLFNSVWNKIYDTSIIQKNDILFNLNLTIGEDAVFNLDYLSHADAGIKIVDKPLYYYQKSANGSLDSSYHNNTLSDQFAMFEAFRDFLIKQKADKKTLKTMNSYMVSSLIAILDRVPSSKAKPKEADLLQSYIEEVENYLKKIDQNTMPLISRIRWTINKHGGYPLDKKIRNGLKKILRLQ